MNITKESVTTDDLALVNNYTFVPLTADQVAIFKGTFADEQPNANKRIYTREWQSQYVKDFVGVPLTIDHSVSVESTYGRVIEARQDAGTIKGRFYIARQKEGAEELIRDIESGAVKGISLEAFAKGESAGEFTRIVPDPANKILAVSLVGVPSCTACQVTREAGPGAVAGLDATDGTVQPDKLKEFASEAVKTLQAEAVKLSALTLGKSDTARALYSRVAESLADDPFTLRDYVATLRTAYAEQRKSDSLENDSLAPVAPDGLAKAIETAKQISKLTN